MPDEAASSQPQTTSSLMVLMFTDIVDSVALKTQLGGQSYRKINAQHDQIFRDLIASIHGAQCLKDTGDGFLARFATATDAVNAALRFQHALATGHWQPQRLHVRIGVHVGEVEELANDISGIPKIVGLAVDIAARIMGLAQGNQILLTQTAYDSAQQYVRDHPPVKGDVPLIEWHRHGQYLLNGLDQAVNIFEVGAVGVAPMTAPPDGEKARRTSGSADQTAVTTPSPSTAPSVDSKSNDSASPRGPKSQPSAMKGVLTLLILAALIGGGIYAWWWKTEGPGRPNNGKQGLAGVTSPGQSNPRNKNDKNLPTTTGSTAPNGKAGTKPNTSKSPPKAPTKQIPSQNKQAPGQAPIPNPSEPKGGGSISPPLTGVDLLDAVNPKPTFRLSLRTGEGKTKYLQGEYITFELQTDKDCYVTMITVDSQGNMTLLMPNNWQSPARARLGRKVLVPTIESEARFPITPPHGKTYIKVIGTLRRLELNQVDLDRLAEEKFINLGNTAEVGKLLTAKAISQMFKPDEWTTTDLTITSSDPGKNNPFDAKGGNQ